MQDVAIRKAVEQRCARRAIGDLSAGEHAGERTTLNVGQRVDFRRAGPARVADSLIFSPIFRSLPSGAL